MTKIAINELVQLCTQILEHTGMNGEDIKIIIDHLLDGELSEKPSHGFYRIPGIVNGVKNAGLGGEIVHEKETPVSTLINASNRPGLAIADYATKLSIKKAKENYIHLVGAYNYVGTTGGIGYFTRQIADDGLIGLMFPNSGSAIAPWGGTTPIFGTNPISVSFPSNGNPIVVDLSTSKWAYGDIDLTLKAGKTLPLGVVVDSNGNESTNPLDALNGSMLPFGEHKGYALALVVELLGGPLVSAKAGLNAVPGTDGFLIMAINPGMFVSIADFKSDVDKLIYEIKNSSKKQGVDELYFPGEKSINVRNKNKQKDYIEVADQVLSDLKKLKDGHDSGDYIT